MKPTIIFDLDGTLINSLPDTTIAINFILAELNYHLLIEEEARNIIGNGLLVLIRQALFSISSETLDEVKLMRYAVCYRRFYTSYPVIYTTVYQDVLYVLSTLLDQGYQLGLCTNKPNNITRAILDKLDLRQYFTSIICGENVPFRKPDARSLRAVMLQMGVQTCIYVGDSVVDVETAYNAGVRSVFVEYGYVQDPGLNIKQKKRAVVIDSLRKLLAILYIEYI